MKKSDFKGKKITVMGVGLHGGGVAVIKYLSEAGARVIATDLKAESELKKSVEKLKDLKNVTLVLGQHRMEDFTNVDMVVKGPAIPWNSPYIQAALEKKIPIEMDSSLFFKLCKLPIIGITGTKGKTTTSTLIFEIMKKTGLPTFSAGVSQKPVLDVLDEIGESKKGVVVFELSSWRLSALGRSKLSPKVAVMTNIYQDHLNYYGTMEKYIADKKNIFRYQKAEDFLVLNYENESVRALAEEAQAKIFYFATSNVSVPNLAFIEGGKVLLRRGGGENVEICDITGIKMRGGHNLYNVLAAVAAASCLEVDRQVICEVIQSFKGVAHRLEFVRELAGVKFYNDTAATMPDAAIAGINAFSEPVVLIAGGSDKKLDFKDFAALIGEKTKKVILLKGNGTDMILTELKKIGKGDVVAEVCDNIDDAVSKARELAQAGDVVLLSPGAASFGLFLNEFDRGDKFRQAVMGLK